MFNPLAQPLARGFELANFGAAPHRLQALAHHPAVGQPGRRPSTLMRINFATTQDPRFWRAFELARLG